MGTNFVIQTFTDGRPLDGGTVSLYPGETPDIHLVNRLEAAGYALTTIEARRTRLSQERTVGFDDGRKAAHTAARTGIIEYFNEVLGDSSGLNDLLEHLGYEKYEPKWLVRMIVEGFTVLEVSVTADSEEDAIDTVSSNVYQTDTEVEVDFDYNGDGDVEDANSFTYEYGNIMDFLHYDFEAEEVQ